MTEVRGNKEELNYSERDMLENTVLPTAEKWVAEMPGLADQGRRTLLFWGELDRLNRAERHAQRLNERRQSAVYRQAAE